jgi:hypothetical protein
LFTSTPVETRFPGQRVAYGKHQGWILSAGTSLRTAAANIKNKGFELDQERALFAFSRIAPIGIRYDVTPDGQRFGSALSGEECSRLWCW